jgi:hypothetical protein
MTSLPEVPCHSNRLEREVLRVLRWKYKVMQVVLLTNIHHCHFSFQ